MNPFRGATVRVTSVLRTVVLVVGVVVVCGCRSVLWFPAAPDEVKSALGEHRLVYDLHDRRVELVSRGNPSRITEVDFFAEDEPRRIVLAEVPPAERRHLVICLDGVSYELVEDLYSRGLFPMFYAPTPMVTVFPAQTDLSFYRMFGGPLPLAFESRYYDREKQRIAGGNRAYVSGVNEPWSAFLDYRLSHLMSAVQFTRPRWFFRRELHALLTRFSESQKKVFIAYLASTAGLGTRYGRTGHVEALLELDRAVRQLVVESEGRVTVTLLADHGHTMVPTRRIPLEKFLEDRGFSVVKKLRRRRDVVPVAFGLLTYVSLYTDAPREVAEALVEMPQVEMIVYREADEVVALSRNGKAVITRRDGRYRYQPIRGDPLDLIAPIDQLRRQGHVDSDGYVEDRALFEATAGNRYPDACKRLWQVFDGLVVHTPDVLLSLSDDSCFGGKLFGKLTPVRSTHAGLNYHNSVTFVMSTGGKIDAPIRVGDLAEALAGIGLTLGLDDGARP